MEKVKMLVCLPVLIVSAISFEAVAHSYIPNDETHISPETAIKISDVSISQVVYEEVTTPGQQLWMTFDATAGAPFLLQIALPYLERLSDYRPTVVLFGPGLSKEGLPFAGPDDMGGLVFSTEQSEPEFFDEPFTGTQSWILRKEQFNLPATGTYYIAAYEPSSRLGKYWVAVGTREAFTLADFATIDTVITKVRAFHEVDKEPLPPLPQFLSRMAAFLRLLAFMLPCFTF